MFQWFRDFNDEYTDTRIPSALSNNENKLIEENIESKLKELTSLQLNLDENLDRIEMIENHQKMIEDELGYIQVI